MSWRAIPPELAVPTVMAALVDVLGLAMPQDQGGPALSLSTGLTRWLLIAYGLLVLRRRRAGRASPMLVAGAALQGVAAAVGLATALSPIVLERRELVSVSGTLSYASSAATVGFAVVMIAATRSWRSPLAPIAILTSLAWHLPRALGELVYSQLSGRWQFQLFFVLAMLAAQVALLGLFARLDDTEASGDPAGAERGARRVALALRLHAALVPGSIVLGVLIVTWPGVWVGVFGAVLGLAALGIVVGQISGLLAMAGARLASLSSRGLYVAGFCALWEVLLSTSLAIVQRGRGSLGLAVLLTVVGTVGMVFAAAALRGVVGRRHDRELRNAFANRIAWIVALQIMSAVAIGLSQGQRPVSAGVLGVFSLAMQVSAILLLAGLFARIADRIQVTAAADVF